MYVHERKNANKRKQLEGGLDQDYKMRLAYPLLTWMSWKQSQQFYLLCVATL